jgi:hypothetical protein
MPLLAVARDKRDHACAIIAVLVPGGRPLHRRSRSAGPLAAFEAVAIDLDVALCRDFAVFTTSLFRGGSARGRAGVFLRR